MSSVITFVPRSDLTAQQNVAAFVELCRERLTTFGATLEFDKDVWDLTDYLQSKADRSSKRLYFSRFGSAKGSIAEPLGKAFSDFAKSYIRYTYAMRPAIVLGSRLIALQAIELALDKTQGETDPTRITAHTLNFAAQLIVDRFGASYSYQAGRELAKLIGFMRKKRMLSVSIKWKNSIPKPPHITRIGPDFEARRDRRLPSVEALKAITSIFRSSSVMSDVLVSSTCAVLCSAPDRISEVLLLPELCDVTKHDSTTGKTLHGLRWFPAKGGPPQVKWPASVMSDTMREAVDKIRHHTNRAREIARWYELNPKQLYLPADLEHLRGAPELTMSQVHQIVFETDDPDAILGGNWCRLNKLKLTKLGGRAYIPFRLVESALLGMLPADFPIADKNTGLKYSEMLFLVQRNALHAQRGTYRSIVEPVVYQNIIRRLSGDTVSNIFARFGYFNTDGSPLSVGTHQFRHYLNTLAQAGGMSQEDIAYWSGRKNAMQNDDYDGVSGNDLLELAEAATSSSAPQSTAVTTRTFALIPRSAWKELGIEAGHTTEFGYCLHDFSMLPCQLHLDCLNCDEQVCVKGDLVREENIRRQRAETESLLKTAESAYGEGEAGSNRWVDHQKKTLTHLNELCNLLDDPKIEVGAAIRLSRIIPPTKLQQSADKIRIAGSPKTR